MAEVWYWWPQTIAEVLEFETDVRMARSAEWRDALKDATQFLTLSHVLGTRLAEIMIDTVKLNALGEWLVPEWPNATMFVGSVSGTVLTVAEPEAYSVGQGVFIGTGPDTWVQREVASVDATTITLTASLGVVYTGETSKPVVIAPLVLCVAPGGLEFQSTFPVQALSIRFMSIEPVDLASNPYPVFAGVPVVIDGRVPFQPLQGGMNQASDLFASGFGAYALQSVETYPRRRGTISWYDKGYAARWERRKFLHYLRGRDGEFWLPTGQSDMSLLSPVSSGATTITVKRVIPDADIVGRVIVIREGDNVVAREVTATGGFLTTQILAIAAPGVSFTVDATISLAVRSRLDTDQVEISYLFAAGGLAATCTAPVIEVP